MISELPFCSVPVTFVLLQFFDSFLTVFLLQFSVRCLFENTHTIFGGRNVYGGRGEFHEFNSERCSLTK